MFYVDMPADAAGKTVHNQLSLWFVVQRGSSASWYGLGDSSRRSYALDAAGNLYDLAPDGNRCLTMPSNRFRGYVYHPFASLTNAGGAHYTPETGDKLYKPNAGEDLRRRFPALCAGLLYDYDRQPAVRASPDPCPL